MSVKCCSMCDKSYIENLPYQDYKRLGPVTSKAFFDALAISFGKKAVIDAVMGLLDQKIKSSGVTAFNERLEGSFHRPNALIHPEDQKYLTHVVHMVSARQLKF
jgi:hypothetical protein